MTRSDEAETLEASSLKLREKSRKKTHSKTLEKKNLSRAARTRNSIKKIR